MVRSDLKGKHRDYCLCYGCVWFKPDDGDKSCRIAAELFDFSIRHNTVNPIWECPHFLESSSKGDDKPE